MELLFFFTGFIVGVACTSCIVIYDEANSTDFQDIHEEDD